VAVVRVNTRNELTLKRGRSDSQVGRVRMEYIAVHETLSDFEQVVRKAWENKVRLPLSHSPVFASTAAIYIYSVVIEIFDGPCSPPLFHSSPPPNFLVVANIWKRDPHISKTGGILGCALCNSDLCCEWRTKSQGGLFPRRSFTRWILRLRGVCSVLNWMYV
jgi:hypothetical protein